MSSQPVGTVTFLFSDIEGSTRILQSFGNAYGELLEEHRRLLRAAFMEWSGYEVDTAGDAFFVAFGRASDAVASAVQAQRALADHQWPEGGAIRVRMGIHTGQPQLVNGGYTGLDVHRGARICSAAHGGQTLISQSAQTLIQHELPAGSALSDLGEHRLKDLVQIEHLYQLDVPDLPSTFPPLRTLSAGPNNLPSQPTALIGREQEVMTLCSMIREENIRLVTLTGPGGTGKTRLSLDAAACMIDEFEAGVYFIQLAPISNPVLVARSIARTLGIHENVTQTVLQTVVEYIGEKRMLLVLDNFEQVVAAAPAVADLLASCPRLKVLVSSRIVLHLRGEQEFPVPPLALPDLRMHSGYEALSQFAAVDLFIQRARSTCPDFVVDDRNVAAVAEICYRLDGLPLAIELAAARIKLLSPQAMLARLAKPLDLLRGGARDLPDRHQTLRQAIAWSYDLLAESERTLFRWLGVFVGGCTLDAVESLCASMDDPGIDPIDGIAALVDQSLLRRIEGAGGEHRFMMLETIREFALQSLVESGDLDRTRRAHAAYMLQLGLAAEPHLTGPEQTVWLDRLDAEHDNIRAAIQWSIEFDDADLALRISTAMWRLWVVRGYMKEGLQQLLAVRTSAQRFSDEAIWPKLLNAAGIIANELGETLLAREVLEEITATCRKSGDRRGLADGLNHLSWVLLHLGDMDDALRLGNEALAICRELGDKRGVASAINNIASVYYMQTDLREAIPLLESNIALREEIGERRGIGFAKVRLGLGLTNYGEFDRARDLFNQGLEVWREIGDQQSIAFTLFIFGDLEHETNHDDRARQFYSESIPLMRRVGNLWGLGNALVGFGTLNAAQREYDVARDLLQESREQFSRVACPRGIGLAMQRLADLHLDRGDLDNAVDHYRQSIELCTVVRARSILVECHLGLGLMEYSQDHGAEAADSFQRATRILDEIGIGLSPRLQGRYGKAIEEVQSLSRETASRV